MDARRDHGHAAKTVQSQSVDHGRATRSMPRAAILELWRFCQCGFGGGAKARIVSRCATMNARPTRPYARVTSIMG